MTSLLSRLSCGLLGAAILLCNTVVVEAQQAQTLMADQLVPANAVSMDGYLGHSLSATYENRILAQDVDRLVAPFRNHTETHLWQGEFWGKWFTSAVLAYRYHPTEKLKHILDSAVYNLLATQTADGYIGNYAVGHRLEEWDIWGRKYVMLGLLAYYDLTQKKQVLTAVQKAADHLIRELADKNAPIVSKGNYKGMAASSVLEPITLLYQRTGNKKYLAFAESIVQQWETPAGPQLISKSAIPVAQRFPYPPYENWVTQGQKAYEMMSCYEGLLELYRVTGNTLYKTAVEHTWESIYDQEINILGSGSASECWYNGKKVQPYVVKHADETCVTVTWIKLSLQLLRLTGDVKYAHAIEQSYYNSLLGAMKPDGSDWGMYSPAMGIRSEGSNQCQMGLNCCTASGPRGVFAFPFSAVMGGGSQVTVNFYNEGKYHVHTPRGQQLVIMQRTTYPVDGDIRIELTLPKAENFTLSVRIPSWSERTRIRVNGADITSIAAGSYHAITRNWQPGDKLELVLDMRGRLQKIDGIPSYLALSRGPLVLARDARLSGPIDVDETIQPVVQADGTVQIQVGQPASSGSPIAYSVPCYVGSWLWAEDAEPRAVTFTNYASAGNTFSEASRYRIWLPQLINPSEAGYIPYQE